MQKVCTVVWMVVTNRGLSWIVFDILKSCWQTEKLAKLFSVPVNLISQSTSQKGPFIIYGRGWAGKNVGGPSKILGNLRGGGRGVIKNMPVGWG